MGKSKRLTQIRAGRMVYAVLYDQARASDEPQVRAAKAKVSSAARQKLNARASWQKCEALMAANFEREDLFLTLTYRNEDLPHSREEAQRRLGAFLRELRAVRAARGEELLYIKAPPEHLNDDGSEGRWHHHLVINATGADYEEIRSLWIWGDNLDFQELLGEGWDYETRARYLVKERQPVGKQAWTPSRNLRRPERRSELVDDALTLAAPPGAQILDRHEEKNAWGEYVYIKYLLPWRPKKPKRKRMPRRQDDPYGSLFSDLG